MANFMAPTQTLQVGPSTKARATDTTAEVHMADSGLYTHAGGAGLHTIDLVTLPAGQLKVYPDLSRFDCSQMVPNADLSIGYRAHTKADGTVVVEDDNAFLDAADAGTAGVDSPFLLPFDTPLELDSVEGITIFATVETANIEDGDTLRVLVAYSNY